MILQKEIRTIAERLKVPSDTVDKDYVLGHFLHELFKQHWAINNLLFKGGSCLLPWSVSPPNTACVRIPPENV